MDARYVRISEDREVRGLTAAEKESIADLNSSLTGQRRACRDKERQVGSSNAVEFVDHDKSASKGKPRRGYRALIAAIERGEVNRVIVLHLSRLWRNRRERAVGIEVMRRHNVTVVAARGPELDMSTAYGRSLAGILGEFDTWESEVKAERVEEWHATRAQQGLHNGGPVAYGYRYVETGKTRVGGRPLHKMVQVPEEARVVKGWFKRFLAGESLNSIARSVGTFPQTIRLRLLSPTYAGLRVHRGVEYGLAGVKPIVDVEVWRAAKGKIEGRKVGSRISRHLLSGLAICERCETATVNAGQADPVAGGGFRTYRCNRAIGGCGRTWRAEWLDDYINGLVGERLSRRDARGMLSLDATREAEELSDEAQGIRARLRALATDHLLKGVDITDAVEAANARLKEIEQLTRPHADEVLAPLLTADNPAKRYNAYTDVVQRQAVISRLMTVILLAPPRGKWPEENRAAWYLERAVRIDWRTS